MWQFTIGMIVVLARDARAVCGFEMVTTRCRDGALTAVVTRVQFGPDGHTPVSVGRSTTRYCDVDGRCDGVCTFDESRSYFDYPVYRVNVGERVDAFDSGSGCRETLICKKGRRARCRRLVRVRPTCTTGTMSQSPIATTLPGGLVVSP